MLVAITLNNEVVNNFSFVTVTKFSALSLLIRVQAIISVDSFRIYLTPVSHRPPA
jgi:hypothetical protein